jgi:hypothetical protein
MLKDVKSTSTSSTSRSCTSTTYATSTRALSEVKLTMNFAVCQLHKIRVVIHRVTLNLINLSADVCQLRIELFIAASLHVFMTCAILWPTLRPLRFHTRTHSIPWDKSLLHRNFPGKWPRTRRVGPGLGSATGSSACSAVGYSSCSCWEELASVMNVIDIPIVLPNSSSRTMALGRLSLKQKWVPGCFVGKG